MLTWHEIVGVVSAPWTVPADWSGAAYIYRAGSTAELDPDVVAVRVARDAAPARRALRVPPTEALWQG